MRTQSNTIRGAGVRRFGAALFAFDRVMATIAA